jgi:hypothetical protein
MIAILKMAVKNMIEISLDEVYRRWVKYEWHKSINFNRFCVHEKQEGFVII